MDYSEKPDNRTIGIIPARYASTRFPGKPLIDINGRSMILRVYDQALLSGALEDVVVATDDQRILDHVLSAGFQAVMTSSAHRSGTDRCLEALDLCSRKKAIGYKYVVNIQGDEPFIPPGNIRQVVELLVNSDVQIASLVKLIRKREDIFNPNVVKVIIDCDNNALYFSRSPIPYLRGVDETRWAFKRSHYKHIGIYGFQADVLHEVCHLPAGRLEQLESLEQLRWLEAGFQIRLGVTDLENISIDTPEDLLKITNTD
jgi:3-deoxy-manno-octulosonate cytidylyltransferase (CMP-KDO synthetase)